MEKLSLLKNAWFFSMCLSLLMEACLATQQQWQAMLVDFRWVAYTPPSGNPNEGVEATEDAIRGDLDVLCRAEFTGLVTYGSDGIMGRELPRIAQEAGFKGLIMGVWDPSSQQEMAAAVAAAGNPIVLGYCVGNEGLPEKGQRRGRYTLEQLTAAIQSLQTQTGKPVATAEQYGDYTDERLLKLGDWVFPTVHPYFYNKREPNEAVLWTKAAFDDLTKRSGRFVLFKEVGLPTAGDPEASEARQEQYYVELAKTDVRFVYFEAFDQPWKTHLPIEPHWGIFKADRTPKLLGVRLLGEEDDAHFYVYQDVDAKANHFTASGYMGDYGDIQMDEDFRLNPYAGGSCIRVVYEAKGKGSDAHPNKWAGIYWQQPPNNWGTQQQYQGQGFDLSEYTRLVFWARAEEDCDIEFKVGGISGPYGDSLRTPRQIRVKLTPTWQRYEISLLGADLRHVIGGFCWVMNWEANPTELFSIWTRFGLRRIRLCTIETVCGLKQHRKDMAGPLTPEREKDPHFQG
jgi:exo-beta-1,3-glucanase (GH17 family)